MRRQLLTYPDPRLRLKSSPIEVFGTELSLLVQDLFTVMAETPNAVGVAAPQLGVFSRVFVLSPVLTEGDPSVYVNPKILAKQGAVSSQEGCLSVPGIVEHIQRAEDVAIEYFDLKGERILEAATGALSIAIQHEIDHLDGKLFIDHFSRLKRKVHKLPTHAEEEQAKKEHFRREIRRLQKENPYVLMMGDV